MTIRTTLHTPSRRQLAVGIAATAALAIGGGRPAVAQESTPALSPREVPPDLEAWVTGWEAQDPAQIVSVYTEEAIVEVVPFGIVLNGVAAIEEYFTSYFGAFDASTATINTVFATADHAGAEWTFFGEYTGALPGLPAGEGQPITARGANIMNLEDGRVAAERIYTDVAGLLIQIGPAAATPVG